MCERVSVCVLGVYAWWGGGVVGCGVCVQDADRCVTVRTSVEFSKVEWYPLAQRALSTRRYISRLDTGLVGIKNQVRTSALPA